MNSSRINTARVVWRLLALCSSLWFSSAVVKAASAEEQSQAVVTLFADVSKTEAFVLGCAEKVPQYKAANSEAYKAWKARNGLERYDEVLRAFSSKAPAIGDQLNKVRASYVALVEKQPLAKLEPICKNLPQTLKQANSNIIQREYAAELKVIGEFARSLKKSPSSAEPSASSDSNSGQAGNGQAGRGNGPKPGHYECTEQWQIYTPDPSNKSAAAQPEVYMPRFTPKFGFDLFATGKYKMTWNATQRKEDWKASYYDGPFTWKEVVGSYVLLEGRVKWVSGYLRGSKYGFVSEAEFKPEIPYGRDERELQGGQFDAQKGTLTLEWTPDIYHFTKTFCDRKGNPSSAAPTQANIEGETPETYLSPKGTPGSSAKGKGGLDGFYVASSGGSPVTRYFFPNGQVWNTDYSYRWGFDGLDCSRVPIGVPKLPVPEVLCQPYSVAGNRLQIGQKTLSFARGANGALNLDGKEYRKVKPNGAAPVDLTLKAYSIGGSGGGTNSSDKKLTLRKDGKFGFFEKSEGTVSTAGFAGVNVSSMGKSGTYKFLPYSLELTFEGGIKVRYSFYRNPWLEGTKLEGSYVLLQETYAPAE